MLFSAEWRNILKNAEILIVGGDRRMTHSYNILRSNGHRVTGFLVPDISPQTTSLEVLKKHISTAKYILCPIPFSRDSININTSSEYSEAKLSVELLFSLMTSKQTLIAGSISKKFTDTLVKLDIPYYDLMTFNSFSYANGYLTAEGLLKDIVDTTPFSITESNILVLGYGYCGSAIARTLKNLGGHITVYNRNKYYDCKAKSNGFRTLTKLPPGDYLSRFNIIINTIPNPVYTKEHLSYTDKNACLFEVASGSGGFQMDVVKGQKFTYRNCPGIPGKTAPRTAARIICDVLNDEIG